MLDTAVGIYLHHLLQIKCEDSSFTQYNNKGQPSCPLLYYESMRESQLFGQLIFQDAQQDAQRGY